MYISGMLSEQEYGLTVCRLLGRHAAFDPRDYIELDRVRYYYCPRCHALYASIFGRIFLNPERLQRLQSMVNERDFKF